MKNPCPIIYLPTPQQIKAAAKGIRSQWTKREMRIRSVRQDPPHWTIPIIGPLYDTDDGRANTQT